MTTPEEDLEKSIKASVDEHQWLFDKRTVTYPVAGGSSKNELAAVLDELVDYSYAYGKGNIPTSEVAPTVIAMHAEQMIQALMTQQCNQARIDELKALRAGRSYKVGEGYRIMSPKDEVRLFYDEFDIDGRIAILEVQEKEQ